MKTVSRNSTSVKTSVAAFGCLIKSLLVVLEPAAMFSRTAGNRDVITHTMIMITTMWGVTRTCLCTSGE